MNQKTDTRDRIEFSFGKTFGIKGAEAINTWGYTTPNQYCHRKDDGHVFNRELVRAMHSWDTALEHGMTSDGFFLWGPTGSGKTSEVVQYHAYLNRPLHLFPGHKRMYPEDLQGSMQIIGGDTVFVQSPLVHAMERGEAVFITEGDRIPAESNTTLHSILDGYPMVLTRDGGRKVYPEPGFRLIYDANTSGGGDLSRHHRGAQVQDDAFMDRFTVAYKPYPEPVLELEILERKSSLPTLFKEAMIRVANDIRERYMGETDEPLDITLSTRTIIRWANYSAMMSGAATKEEPLAPFYLGVQMALTNRARPEVADAIDELIQRQFTDLQPTAAQA